jgi:hypothetical protein
MKNWLYKDPSGSISEYTDINNFKKENIGFIYLITNIINNKIYIGRKSLYSNINKKLTKKELSEQTGPGRKPTKKLVTSESNWKLYCGSSKELLKDIKEIGEDKFTREILHLCNTKKQLTFYEIQYQIIYKVLEVDSYNDNILGKFYRKDLV